MNPFLIAFVAVVAYWIVIEVTYAYPRSKRRWNGGLGYWESLVELATEVRSGFPAMRYRRGRRKR